MKGNNLKSYYGYISWNKDGIRKCKNISTKKAIDWKAGKKEKISVTDIHFLVAQSVKYLNFYNKKHRLISDSIRGYNFIKLLKNVNL